ncbi:type III secretion system FliI/YscN family ATPase [Hydrogenispora ethanolica]|jgi:flagellum-specific ATP synthase|uniref:Type 3 secretion system ATPase n=1 Tax=Hydrogenispora ethanolica TaxID=1082276 RepID=A0A4R1RLB0_HYDET|nr:flagellar protein export ATPase FliI [Hydrogenispora ethanolica]TCL66542.1 type III secretion system FliI/YscN family ATPase [Hydrogenispora ethanolica]
MTSSTCPPFSSSKYLSRLADFDPVCRLGRVDQIVGLTIEADGPAVNLGELCFIQRYDSPHSLPAEVVGFKSGRVLLMPLGELEGLAPGSQITATGQVIRVQVGPELLGRILDGLGRPIDDGNPLESREFYPISAAPPNPLTRRRISAPLTMGIRAMDSLLTCGRGQRVGIFAGSGVGKSTLLGMIARNTDADVNVIALIGERGREVRDFIERDLGPEGLARSVVVVATSDQPALVRLKGAMVATAIAEYFRDQGRDVMLMMDSVTRFAIAQREVGLAIGEPPTTRGFTPSVFALLPRLLERSGTAAAGSITGLYTVLVEGDDMNEPIADAVRGILDGHIVLSRDLAHRNHYPAIDVLASVSRLMVELASAEHRQAASELRNLLATYRNQEDLINIGAYAMGSNPRVDQAIQMQEAINGFLCQRTDEKAPFPTTIDRLLKMFGGAKK